MFDVAIIGNGASAVATLKALFSLIKKRNIQAKICLIGKLSNMGYGFSYNEDNDCAIMNTPASNISINSEDPLEFIEWAHKNGFYFLAHHNIPRRIYGKYLHDTAIELSENEVTLLDAYASSVKKKNGLYEISTLENRNILVKRIILCAGVSRMNDFFNLSGLNGYVFNPYPLHHQLSSINKNESILILGSGLTAVDIAVYLFWRQHKGKIILCSRQGRLPVVKSIVKTYMPKWCRFSYFVKIFEKQRAPLTLRQILRVIRRELKSVGADWIKIFFPKEPDSAAIFIEKVKVAQEGLAWLDVLIGIQHEIDLTWAYVKKEHKAFFIEKYLPNVLRAIAPIPLINANIVCKLFSEGQMEIIGGITSIQKEDAGFIIQHGSSLPALKVDCVINATGFDRHISLDDTNLISNLIKKGIIYSHSSGGIQVCAKTGRTTSDERIFSVGQLTIGEHPLINNIEFIVMNANATAVTIVNEIQCENECYIAEIASAF